MSDRDPQNEPQSRPSMRDAHLHLAWEHAVPPSFIHACARNIAIGIEVRGRAVQDSDIAARLSRELQDPTGARLVAQMDAANISRGALLVPDLTFALPGGKLSIEEILRHHHDVGQRHPGRFALFAGVDPRWSNDGIALFERSIREWNYQGLKLYPPCGFHPSDRSVYPYYELCRHHRLPVLVHIGPSAPNLGAEHVNPFSLDRAVRDFPEVPFILGHGTAHFVEESIMLAVNRPNVFIETSGCHRGGPLTVAAANILGMIRQGLGHKMLFGSDWPVFRYPLVEMVDALFGPKGICDEVSPPDLDLLTAGIFDRIVPGAGVGPAPSFR